MPCLVACLACVRVVAHQAPLSAYVASFLGCVVEVALHAVALPARIGRGVIVLILVTLQTSLVIAINASSWACDALVIELSESFHARALFCGGINNPIPTCITLSAYILSTALQTVVNSASLADLICIFVEACFTKALRTIIREFSVESGITSCADASRLAAGAPENGL